MKVPNELMKMVKKVYKVMMDKRHNVVLLMHISHIEMKMEFYS